MADQSALSPAAAPSAQSRAKIQLAVSLNAAYSRDRSPVAQFEERLEQVRAARDAGFVAVWMGEHYLARPEPWFQNTLAMARFAAETGAMGLGAIILLSLRNPIELAEQIATLDVISGGRFACTLGQGWREEEFEAFNIPIKTRVGRFREGLEIMKRLWTDDDVTFTGKHFTLRNVTMLNRPIQQPHPKIWIAASSEAAVRRAADLGHPWMTSAHTPFAMLEKMGLAYRARLEELGQPPPPDVAALRHVHVAATFDAAVDEAGPYLEEYYQAFGSWGLFRDVIKLNRDSLERDEVLQGRPILGGPDDVVAQMQRFHELFGVTYFVCRVGQTRMPHPLVMKTIRQLGSDVLPQLS